MRDEVPSDLSAQRAADWLRVLGQTVGALTCQRRRPKLRYDITDSKGAMTLRRGGRLYHLKVGAAHARRRVLAFVDAREVTVVALDTGEILSAHLIEPDRGYWRNQRRDPGRGPGSQATS